MKKVIKIIYYIIFIFLLLVIIGCFINIFMWFKDNKMIEKESNIISSKINVKKVKDNKDTIIIKKDNEESKKDDPYWDFIKMNLMDVDITKLKETNNDTIGFVKVNGTNVNYPFVQTNDNKYYLTHSFKKEKNKAGWVFMDYRNKDVGNDDNTILYAHGRVNNTMFGSLNKIINDKWLNNKDNHVVSVSTENKNSLWQIFSVYHIEVTNDYTITNFENENSYAQFLNKITSRSVYNFNNDPTSKDKIITLSTCYNKTERMVVHAKLIKYQDK